MNPIDKTTATIDELDEWLTYVTYALRGAKDFLDKAIDANSRLLISEDIEALKQEMEDTKEALKKAHLEIGEILEFPEIIYI